MSRIRSLCLQKMFASLLVFLTISRTSQLLDHRLQGPFLSPILLSSLPPLSRPHLASLVFDHLVGSSSSLPYLIVLQLRAALAAYLMNALSQSLRISQKYCIHWTTLPQEVFQRFLLHACHYYTQDLIHEIPVVSIKKTAPSIQDDSIWACGTHALTSSSRSKPPLLLSACTL